MKRTKVTKKKESVGLFFLMFVSFVGFAASMFAQDQPVFRSGVQVIEADVRVFDKDGHFVADLRPEEFELLEDGQPQRVQTLYLVSEKGTVTVAGPPASGSAAASSPGGPSAVPPAAARQTWIFMFDLQHLTPGGAFGRAQQAVTGFIQERFKDGDLAGVVAGTRMVNNRLTSVREELIGAVSAVKPLPDARRREVELTREWPRLQDAFEAALIVQNNRDAIDRAVTRACTEDPDACRMTPPDAAVREKAQRVVREEERASMETLTSLNALASGLARMPGPKTVVFLSDGFVVQQIEATLRNVVGQMTRAGARVYAIDLRGLNRGRGAGIIDQPHAEDEAGGLAHLDAQEDGTNSLAVDTGGMLIRNENNVGRALGLISADANEYYVIGYQPTNSAFDGKFRPIQVRVKRADVRVRARRGYLALEPAKMLVPQPVKTTPPVGTVSPAAPDADAPPTPAAPVEPAPSGVTSAATLIGAPTAPTGNTIRLRPDTGARVAALSGGDLASADAPAKKGWEAYQRGDVDAALPLLQQAAASPGARPWVVYTLGFSQVALGRPVDAAQSWERVRASAPEFEPVYIDLADTYVQLSELGKALAVLRDAVKRWPADPELHNAIGVIYVRRGALDEALSAFSKAAEVSPNEALAYFNLARTYELRYSRGQRYVSSQRRWTSSEDDRRHAIENYTRYVKLGGPYVTQASEGIARLEWSK